MVIDLIDVKLGDRILDVGCRVNGPMQAIVAHSCAKVVGIIINDYQVNRAHIHNKKVGLDLLCEVVCGNFLEMPFSNNSFNGTYSIEDTCHVLKLEEVYAEIFRVLKPRSIYVSKEREKCLEAKKMKKNENPETLKCLRAFFFFFYRKSWVEFGYIVLGLNEPHWIFI